MSDLVDRLRAAECAGSAYKTMCEAAGEIERLIADSKKMHSEIRAMVELWEKSEDRIAKLEGDPIGDAYTVDFIPTVLVSNLVTGTDSRDERIAKLEAANAAIKKFIDAQAEDAGLWFVAQTAAEGYVQRGLRSCHAYIEQVLQEVD